MVTRIHKQNPGRLFLREHRKEKKLSAKVVAERMGMERESLLRFERLAVTRANPEKLAAYADALQTTPEALRRPPGAVSLDEMVKDAPDNVREMVVDVVKRMISRGS